MKEKYFLGLVLLALFTLTGIGQVPSTTPTTADDTVKITTKLVQLDAVVLDKNGRPVTDLTPADFQVLQDGKPQKITNLSYVSTQSDTVGNAAEVKSTVKVEKGSIPSPPVKSSGRIITFVIDDGNCSASTLGMMAARDGLKKFISEQMRPGDRVAIYRTRAGSSTLQQYLSDKTQLLRTADSIRWYPASGGCSVSDGSFFEAARSNTIDNVGPNGPTTSQVETADEKKTREASEDFNRNNKINGSLGLLNYVVRGLEKVGGRKIVFFMSDGLQIRSRSGQTLSANDALHDLTELANRAGVVFDTIDVRGVYSNFIEAGDEVRTKADVNASDAVIATRDQAIQLAEDGLYYLAGATGGQFYKNNNHLDAPVSRVLSQENGYYLIGYEPDEDTFRGKHFNKIEIKLSRPDLKVTTRPGFDAVVDPPARSVKHTGESDLYEAIAAPLPQAGLNLQLTAYFGNSLQEGTFVRSLIHLNGDEITFVDDEKGLKKAVFDVVAVTLDGQNKVVDEFNRTHTFKVPAEALPMIQKNGLIYSTDVPVKKSGVYNFRVAVRDASSKALGSSSQIIEIPDLKKSQIFLSGLTVSQVGENGKFIIPGQVKPENALTMTTSTANPASRQFHPGAVLAYAYTIYNPRLDKTTQEPSVSVQMKLFRDGEVVSEGKPEPAKFEKQTDWSRTIDFSYLRLNPNAQPGNYTIQVIVKDLLSTDKNAVSSQWVDFEIVK